MGAKQILDIVYNIIIHISRLPERPVFTSAGPKEPAKIGRGRFKVTLGIIPSYGSLVDGVKIDGISNPNGPAANAGIQKGDILKALNEKPIKDIYEYMNRLAKFEKGQTITVTIDRDGTEKEFSVTF